MSVDSTDAAAKRLVIGKSFMFVPRRTEPAGAEEACPGLCRSLEHLAAKTGATRRAVCMMPANERCMGKITQATVPGSAVIETDLPTQRAGGYACADEPPIVGPRARTLVVMPDGKKSGLTSRR
jgi:hypothetical protein